jgi:CheY-like chemotaxis protein
MMEATQPRSLLLVEDNPADIELVKEWVSEKKVDVEMHFAEDGQVALDHLQRCLGDEGARLPDLILLDINLPRRSGIDVLRELKNQPQLQKIPVVMLTSSNAPDDVNSSYMAHANAYVQKGVNLDSFYRSLNCIHCLFFETAVLPQG